MVIPLTKDAVKTEPRTAMIVIVYVVGFIILVSILSQLLIRYNMAHDGVAGVNATDVSM
jgi:hypothetical protein